MIERKGDGLSVSMTTAMNRNTENDKPLLFGIGELSRLSGVPVDTLRNWERRFAWPVPERLDSGHRRYSADLVPHLRLIHRALKLGFKASFAVAASFEELESSVLQVPASEVRNDTAYDREIAHWTASANRWDSLEFETSLRRSWAQLGAKDFIAKLAVPFLHNKKEMCAQKSDTIGKSHFACQQLSTFLAAQWQPISNQNSGGKVVIANLEGDFCPAGIHMAAVFLALHRFNVINLGPDTSVHQIGIAARDADATALVIGLSPDSVETDRVDLLRKLRAETPASVPIAVIGAVTLEAINGVKQFESVVNFDSYAESLAEIYGGDRG